MPNVKQRTAAKEFATYWEGRGSERRDTQMFLSSLLSRVYGIDNPERFIFFEEPVQLGNTSYADAIIPSTRVIIEQKSLGIDLSRPERQSDGSFLTPFEQAKRYSDGLPYSSRARWIVTCNFAEFWVYDMEHPNSDPEKIKLADLETEYYRLRFLVDSGNNHLRRQMDLSFAAGEIVGQIYKAFHDQYLNPDSEESLRSLNILCVRLVFCLYAEDADIFTKDQFHDYMVTFEPWQMHEELNRLFEVLNIPKEDRPRYLNSKLAEFPYVNGGLFSGDIEIPPFTEDICTLLLKKASADFNWATISPTIFGAVFESTLNPETQRHGGMHYTSVENIHKVIDPLFLDNLEEEFNQISSIEAHNRREINAKTRKLKEFQIKLATLTFLDPACGSGNFLTETYMSLRKLENRVLKLLYNGQTVLNEEFTSIKVNIDQFYGIEINDFAVAVAQTALWIAESQMIRETEEIIDKDLNFLPLKTNTNIIIENALRIDWNTVISKDKLNYIIGNPPFIGARIMTAEQKADLNTLASGWKNAGNLDYVVGWYIKAAQMMIGTSIRAALVSTNSVSQGESVANLWKPLMAANIHIDFAYRTFRWDSEATLAAHVHCVIIGFSVAPNKNTRIIYINGLPKAARNINGYLVDGDNTFVESRNKPLCKVPQIGIGNKPIDGGNYLFTKEEMLAFIHNEPAAEKYFRLWYGSDEFINRRPRYCLWLGDCSPHELREMPECMKRVNAVRELRLNSRSPGTVKLADKPTRFHVENMPTKTYILIPEVSSSNRHYIPMGFMNPNVLCSNLVKIIPNASLYHFGILTSNVHMAWMRAVAGRLKSDYRYSKDIVYNNFPWPNPTKAQKEMITQTAQAILNARNDAIRRDRRCTLADLYNDDSMPDNLREAHTRNDIAVMEVYRFTRETASCESNIVAELMKRYQRLAKRANY